jgi:hypothetical protein
MTKEISLTQGMVAIVPDECYDSLMKYRWFAKKCGSKFYVVKNVKGSNKKWRQYYIHRIIWEMVNGPIPEELEMDHINGNTLDNRLSNLRLSTHSQNNANKQKVMSVTSSKFKGVYYAKWAKRWRSRIKCNKLYISIGYFDTEQEAARAYDIKAKELFGAFAILNIPE